MTEQIHICTKDDPYTLEKSHRVHGVAKHPDVVEVLDEVNHTLSFTCPNCNTTWKRDPRLVG